MDFLTIESHFGVPGNLIRSHTRNKCSDDFVGIISGIAKILYPEEEFEIYLLPAEDGSYTDIIRIFNNAKKELRKNPIIIVTTVGILAVSLLNYADTHSQHLHDEKMQVVDDTAKCLSLKQQIAELSKQYEIEELPEEKLNEVCGNISLKKLKNDRYKTLQEDEMVSSDETIVKNSKSEIIFVKKVERDDFECHIEALPENEKYLKQNLEGVIELESLVLRQKKEGRGIQWRGFYFGDDIKERGINIISNNEEISFYMQDADFKEKIDNHQIVFKSGDNMRVLFDISGDLNIDTIQNISIYIKEVKKFNADIIEHKAKPSKTNPTPSEDQMTLLI